MVPGFQPNAIASVVDYLDDDIAKAKFIEDRHACGAVEDQEVLIVTDDDGRILQYAFSPDPFQESVDSLRVSMFMKNEISKMDALKIRTDSGSIALRCFRCMFHKFIVQ